MKNLKRTIAIVCGGDSSEHDVSMRSAQGLYSFFDKERYDVYIVEMKGYNWRVELWGEGRGLQTFRRWGKEVERGDNHMYKSRSSMSPFQPGITTFEIPTGETMYNPYLRQTTELATKQ